MSDRAKEILASMPPFYAYGDNEAACWMADRIHELAELAAPSPEDAPTPSDDGRCPNCDHDEISQKEINGEAYWYCLRCKDDWPVRASRSLVGSSEGRETAGELRPQNGGIEGPNP